MPPTLFRLSASPVCESPDVCDRRFADLRERQSSPPETVGWFPARTRQGPVSPHSTNAWMAQAGAPCPARREFALKSWGAPRARAPAGVVGRGPRADQRGGSGCASSSSAPASGPGQPPVELQGRTEDAHGPASSSGLERRCARRPSRARSRAPARAQEGRARATCQHRVGSPARHKADAACCHPCCHLFPR